MSDVKLESNYDYFFYDPTIYGCNEDIIRKISGTVDGNNGKIRFIAGSATSTIMAIFGDLRQKVLIPTAPTAGDKRIFGYYSRAYPNRNSAYFYISGTNFYARTYDDDGIVIESTTIVWESDWTNASIDYEIRCRINRVEFWIDGRKMATHSTKVPRKLLLPLYWYNGNSDSMLVDYFEIRNARKIFNPKPDFYTTYAVSVSPSASPSTSISPSVSPSTSPSTSISPSVSPSASPSTSISPSLSPSLSPSTSPSASVSSSISPSLSPPNSTSPSLSPSLSNSVSSSISPSISSSISPSISSSVSPSVSPSSSISPSVSPSF